MILIRAASSLVVVGLLAVAMPNPAGAQSAEAYFEFLMARRLEAQGDFADALAALERAATAAPASAEIRAEIASFQLRRNRRTDAEAAAREALTLNADNVEAHRVLGLIYASAAQEITGRARQAEFRATAREAISHLERAVGDTWSQADVAIQYTLGRLYLRMGDAAAAVEALTRVVNRSPNSLQGNVLLAQAYAASGDVQGAITTLERMVDAQPRVASTLAQYQEQAGLLKEAAENYKRALELRPGSRNLKFRRASVVLRAMEYELAATLAAEAQTDHPDDLRFPRLRARALLGGGDSAGALSVLEATARAFPEDTATQFALADVYVDTGQEDDAERTLRQLLAGEPDNADALNYLGYLLADQGRQLEEAIKLVQRALDADPGNPSYLDSLGWAYFRLGDFAQAEKYIAPAAGRLDRNSVIQDHFGDVLAALGQWQEAITAWTQAIDGDGNDIDRAVIEKKIGDARARVGQE